jgi:hypothetical protein
MGCEEFAEGLVWGVRGLGKMEGGEMVVMTWGPRERWNIQGVLGAGDDGGYCREKGCNQKREEKDDREGGVGGIRDRSGKKRTSFKEILG